MNYLLIGGPADGERVFLRGLPRTIRKCVKRVPHAQFASGMLETADYRLEEIVCEGESLYVYVVDGMTTHNAMLRLLCGYEGTSEKREGLTNGQSAT